MKSSYLNIWAERQNFGTGVPLGCYHFTTPAGENAMFLKTQMQLNDCHPEQQQIKF
ncbi:MAG: hypothetical protein SPI81_00980 [Candidatus Faecousia sp.]|nr:hypothetical protein [Candidatus Faecousia sp.]